MQPQWLEGQWQSLHGSAWAMADVGGMCAVSETVNDRVLDFVLSPLAAFLAQPTLIVIIVDEQEVVRTSLSAIKSILFLACDVSLQV